MREGIKEMKNVNKWELMKLVFNKTIIIVIIFAPWRLGLAYIQTSIYRRHEPLRFDLLLAVFVRAESRHWTVNRLASVSLRVTSCTTFSEQPNLCMNRLDAVIPREKRDGKRGKTPKRLRNCSAGLKTRI